MSRTPARRTARQTAALYVRLGPVLLGTLDQGLPTRGTLLRQRQGSHSPSLGYDTRSVQAWDDAVAFGADDVDAFGRNSENFVFDEPSFQARLGLEYFH